MSTAIAMAHFIAGLKHRSEEVRFKTANDLHHFVSTELREMPLDEHTSFMDDFNHHIFEMVSSSDINERKGGILAIVSLIGVDIGNTTTRISRFANYLRNLLPSNDVGVMEMAAQAVGLLALTSGTYVAEYVEFEVKRALEWLTGDRHEGRRHAAVLVLKELAVSTPTFFFQQVQQFFDCIFSAVRDPKPIVREGAVAALRAALAVTSQRETKATQRSQWYKQCYEEAKKIFDEPQGREKRLSRDDWAHGSLLIINELLRCSNVEGERLRIEMEEITAQQNQHRKTYKELQGKKVQGNVSALQQLQNKLSPLSNFGLSARPLQSKATFFESRTCKELMSSHFEKVCGMVLRHRGSRSLFVQQTLLMVIPRLAAFNPPLFSRKYLIDTMNFLLIILKNSKEKTQAFQAVGLLAVSVQEEISSFLPRIMEVIKTSLPPKDLPLKKHKHFVVDPAVFTCISMLARAVGLSMSRDIKELLEPMMAVGLSPALTAALRDLATQIPQLKTDIQDGLLRMLSIVLMGRPLRHPGAPKSPTSPIPMSSSVSNLAEPQDVTSITLALRTLGSFDFEGHSLTQFVRHCAETYLSSENKGIRTEAVKTCARLLTPLLNLLSSQPGQSVAAMNTVAEVLNKLLVVGITDSDSDIRYCVLASLDERFDPHLAQAENLSALFVALNDEVFEIRELAICIIGRLSCMNPAYVMPSLRKTLIQILTELEHSGVGRNKEQAARLLGHLVSNAARLIRPYMEPILKVLIPKLKEPDSNPAVTICVLAAIGELAQVSGVDIRKWVDELLPIILEMLQDSSALQKREVALWSLGQMVESTGYVVEPYKKYPSLLEVLLNFLKTEQSPGIRREVIRVLGLLGALDPHKHKMNIGVICTTGDSAASVGMTEKKSTQDASQPGEYNTSEMLVNMSSSTTLEEFYPAVAIATLMRIIRDPSLSQHHTMVVQAITFIFKSLGIKCVPYIQQVVPAYLTVIRTADTGFREFLFQQLGVIIAIVKQHIRNYLDDIFALIKDFWTLNSPMQNTIILLVEQIVSALGTEFKIYLPQIIPQILRVFMHDTSAMRSVTAKLLNALQLFGANLDDYLHLLLPPVVKLFDSQDVPMNVRRISLETIDKLTDSLDLTDFASRIIHPLARTIDSVPELRGSAMDTLCSLVMQLGQKFTIFIPMVNRVISKQRVIHPKYDMLLCRILKGPTFADDEDDPLLAKHRQNRNRKTDTSGESTDTATIKKLHVSSANLQKALTAGRRVSKEDWMEWLRRLSIELLKESPSPALRSCWALAQTYNPLARDLFNAAFVSCWTELSETQQDELISSLEQALTSQELPEITQTLLNLAEFMEHCDKGPLPLETKLLGQRAIRCRAYAKALHYKEDEFHRNLETETLEALISINNKLQQPEAAAGVLEYAMRHHRADLKIQENWYEKLHEWNKALAAYERKQEQAPDNHHIVLGRMRCLEALAEWGQLHQLACEKWTTATNDMRSKMARMASAAAWGLGHWESMEEYICFIPRTSYDGAFYRAVFTLHEENYHMAQQCIDKARDILDTELTAMAGESYNRAYGAMVNVQMLSELEEIIQYKLVPERQAVIKQMWWDRLQVSEELIRVAILWHELWHEGLEEASRLYFGERNVKGMFSTLEPLHGMIERGPQTLKETSFNQAYGRDLIEAQEWCKKYQKTGNVKDLTQAWDLYYHVFRRISKQLPQLTSLELQYVSPKLLRCLDLELAVPGSYEPNQPIVRIHHVQSSLQVITSKQRPRKLSIFGSNGQEYMFLLKGHEDLRQDERVMQLFGLVNSLLLNNPETFRKNLSIQRYAVIPLSTNSGLIGWVPHCDTLHSLIRDYREKKKILLNIEHRLMLRMAPEYDHLTLMQKVEVFEHALEHTQGDDLAKILWYKSPSSEVWFDRRTNYTRSLAVMSMVGYVLGLGDRHPSNLMLDRMSGKITHIDFGDCFEVAMTREKFPEKIPFRLTRMLINAMEVTGIDGNYTMTCESVMEVLREHKDSLMAVLEAFVYDPLLNWRLMDTTTKTKPKGRSDSYSGGSQEQDILETGDMTQTSHKKTNAHGEGSPEGDSVPTEALNKKAISIVHRVRDKLTGRDFPSTDPSAEPIDVPDQVELLIKQATSHENLCQCYIGWCPFW
ncbi:serine/threonine-protein kinase mTOR-like [Liolophura sinensis]|uniref:serine/threonine-protein kinase mTOR-like n=1 Tax=Liolophura sinensis TaxID=3198878 RepID=UPI00315965BC